MHLTSRSIFVLYLLLHTPPSTLLWASQFENLCIIATASTQQTSTSILGLLIAKTILYLRLLLTTELDICSQFAIFFKFHSTVGVAVHVILTQDFDSVHDLLRFSTPSELNNYSLTALI